MIISVGYRVKSARGVEFRRWANKILKDYIVQGYAINERRLAALNRVVEIQSNIIAGVLDLDAEKVLEVVKRYSLALEMLDDYDHQTITKPKISSDEVYKLTYEECRNLISKMSYSKTSDIFGKEKGKGLSYYPHFKWGFNINPSGVLLWFRQRRDFAIPFLPVAS